MSFKQCVSGASLIYYDYVSVQQCACKQIRDRGRSQNHTYVTIIWADGGTAQLVCTPCAQFNASTINLAQSVF